MVQTKLKIGEPNDKFEQEADRVAEEVIRMPEPQETNRAARAQQSIGERVQRLCPECEEELHRQPIEEEEEELQAKATSRHTPEVAPDLESRINSLKGGEQPLPQSLRSFFEPRFGYDFSQVRVHTDRRAAETARAVNARAYTIGQRVVFGAGEYSSGTTEGRRLLAHELTHVVQQWGFPFPSIGSNFHRPRWSSTRSDRLMREISFASDCSDPRAPLIPAERGPSREVVNNVTRAQSSAARWARAGAVALLNPERAASLLGRHFQLTPVHAAAIARVRRTLGTIARYLDADAFSYNCRPDSDPSCQGQDGREYAGFAYPGNFQIFFCDPFPYQDFFGHKSLIDTLLHEAAHAHDAAFNHDTYEHNNSYPPANAITNAESYASFARDAALGVGTHGLELTLGGVLAAEPQLYIAVGQAGDVGGPFLDVFNLRLGQRIAFTPRAGEEPARGLTTVDIGLRINPIRERIYVDLTTGAFLGANFTDEEAMAGIANRLTAGFRGERVDLGLDLSHFLDLVTGENLVIVGVRGALRFP